MYSKKLIAAMVAWIFLMGVPVALGKRVNAPSTDHGRPESPSFSTIEQEAIVLAEKDNSTPDSKEKTTSGSATKGSKSEPAADDKNKSSNAKSKPLKPFVPSEKIPGDQAVDFPVDI